MPKTNNKIIFTLPSEMMREIERLIKKERITRSEILKKALSQYIEDKEWKEILKYGQRKAKEKGITKAKIEDIVDAYRK